eukprot:134732-Lingulodinium_polyedra.AAC.1
MKKFVSAPFNLKVGLFQVPNISGFTLLVSVISLLSRRCVFCQESISAERRAQDMNILAFSVVSPVCQASTWKRLCTVYPHQVWNTPRLSVWSQSRAH